MKKAPSIFTINSLHDSMKRTAVEIDGKWYPARPEGFWSMSYRVKAAWMVFTGKADAVIWPAGQ